MEPSHMVSQCIKSKRFVSEEKQQKQQYSVLGFKHEQSHQLCDWALNDALHLHIETLYIYSGPFTYRSISFHRKHWYISTHS